MCGFFLPENGPERRGERRIAVKLIGLLVGDEHDQRLDTIAEQLGWSRSRVVRELVSRAVVEGQPRIHRVVLPAAADVEVVHRG
jgi:hypothetical protein